VRKFNCLEEGGRQKESATGLHKPGRMSDRFKPRTATLVGCLGYVFEVEWTIDGQSARR
jgi:hypothetical protein